MLTDEQVDQELQASVGAAKKQAVLIDLMKLFRPEGPSETLLLQDLANVRCLILDADSRRTSLMESLRTHAENLYDERVDVTFQNDFCHWQKSPVSHRQTILSTSAGVNTLKSLWLAMIRSTPESQAFRQPWALFWLLPQLGGSLNPFQASADGQDLVNCFVSMFPDKNEFLEQWRAIAPDESAKAMEKWCETSQFDNVTDFKRISEICMRELNVLNERLVLLQQAEQTARKQFAHSYRASDEHNVSLRNINADRKVLQQRHDQTLRMLTQVQERRLREAARKAERQAAKEAKAKDISANNNGKLQHSDDRPAIIRLERSPAQPDRLCNDGLMPTDAGTRKMPKLAEVINQASEPLLTDECLVELEINLAHGEAREVPLIHAAQLLRLWEDHDFEPAADRFNYIFGKLTNIDDLNTIRELFAEERNRRHDKNKLLEVA